MNLLDNLLFDSLPYGPMMLGVVLTFRYLRQLDLTFAASFVIGPAAIASSLLRGDGLLAGVLTAITSTILLTMFSVFLSQRLRIDNLLASLLASFSGFSLTLLLTQGTVSLTETSTPLTALINFDESWFWGRSPLHPSQVAAFLLITLTAKRACDLFLESELGLAFRAMEDAKSAEPLLRSLGIAPTKILTIGLISGNLLCMLSGSIVMLKEGQVTAQRGFDVLLTLIAAYLLGTNLFERRAMPPTPGSRVTHLLSIVQRMKPTTAALSGLIFYYALLTIVSRFDIPSSIPRLIFVALIVGSFGLIQLQELREAARTRKSDLTIPAACHEGLQVKFANVSYPGYPDPIQPIKDVSLEAKPGTVSQLSGENGTGKSTLLKYVAGWIPGKGQIVLPISNPSPSSTPRLDRQRIVAYISQDAGLTTSAHLSTREHVAMFEIGSSGSAWKPWKKRLTPLLRETIKELGIARDDLPAGVLSGGQKQVLSLASLSIRKDSPRVILLDEPLTYLDESNAQRCISLIERFKAENRVILIVQHDLQPHQHYPTSSARSKASELIDKQTWLTNS